MWVTRAVIHKMLIRLVNRKDSDQNASSDAVWSGSVLFVNMHFGRQLVSEILDDLPYIVTYFKQYIILIRSNQTSVCLYNL